MTATDRTVKRIRAEGLLILLMVVVAGVRIFLFSAAFPFFGNVDESPHFDVIYKYATGHVPGHLEHFSARTGEAFARYSSPEFGATPRHLRTPWSYPPDVLRQRVHDRVAEHVALPNRETTQPPVYYALAACWYRLGEALGITGARLLYWLRFMNVWIYCLLVWVAYMLVRRLFPANAFIRLGVPLVLAFFPQDVFYSLNNDVPSALLFTLSFWFLLEIHFRNSSSCLFHAVTGLLAAAAVLTKFTNAPIVVMLALVAYLEIRAVRNSGAARAASGRVSLLAGTCGVPIAAWMIRSKLLSGDFTGSAAKAASLGWTRKPFYLIPIHPVFTPDGFLTFAAELTRTFWRGELYWHNTRMTYTAADVFYLLSTLVFLGVSAYFLFRKRRPMADVLKFTHMTSWLMIGISVLMLMVISASFDFGSCRYPSRWFPYLTSGRLISGVTVPFLILYLDGFDLALSRVNSTAVRLGILLFVMMAVTASEVVISIGAFRSAFNWFHLP